MFISPFSPESFSQISQMQHVHAHKIQNILLTLTLSNSEHRLIDNNTLRDEQGIRLAFRPSLKILPPKDYELSDYLL